MSEACHESVRMASHSPRAAEWAKKEVKIGIYVKNRLWGELSKFGK